MENAEEVRNIREASLEETKQQQEAKEKELLEGVKKGVELFMEDFWENKLIPKAKKGESYVSLYYRDIFSYVSLVMRDHKIEEDRETLTVCQRLVDKVFTEEVEALGFRITTFETSYYDSKSYDIEW